jgi:hypothetical protein
MADLGVEEGMTGPQPDPAIRKLRAGGQSDLRLGLFRIFSAGASFAG